MDVYFAGELFSAKHIIGNAVLAAAIETVSEGRFSCILPQALEQRGTTPRAIRDQDLEAVYRSDVALFNFDGTEVDSGTVVEFMFAKFLDIPSVILRTDFRAAGDSGDLLLAFFLGGAVRDDSQRDGRFVSRDADFRIAAACGEFAQQFFGLRFPDAKAVDASSPDDSLSTGETRADLFEEHAVHLARDAGHGRDEARIPTSAGQFHPDARRSTNRIEERETPLGKHGLNAVAFGHGAASTAKEVFELRQRCGIQFEVHAGQLGEDIAGEIIERGPEAAGDEDHIGPLDGQLQCLQVGGHAVGDGGVKQHGNAEIGELQTEPLAVGVQLLAAGQLGADGNNFRLHDVIRWSRSHSRGGKVYGLGSRQEIDVGPLKIDHWGPAGRVPGRLRGFRFARCPPPPGREEAMLGRLANSLVTVPQLLSTLSLNGPSCTQRVTM